MKQKGFAPILIIIVIVLLVGGVYLVKGSVQPASRTQYSQDDTPSTNPTVNWKMYIDNKIGYSVKYPPEMISSRGNCDSFILPASDEERKSVENVRKSGIEIGLSLKGLQMAFCEMANPRGLNAAEFAQNHSPSRKFVPTSLDGQTGVIAINNGGSELFIERSNNRILRAWSYYTNDKDKIIFNQILSTFHFTQ